MVLLTPVLRFDEKGREVEWRSCQSRTDETHDSVPPILRNIKALICLPVSYKGLGHDIVCPYVSDLLQYLLVQDMLLTKPA